MTLVVDNPNNAEKRRRLARRFSDSQDIAEQVLTDLQATRQDAINRRREALELENAANTLTLAGGVEVRPEEVAAQNDQEEVLREQERATGAQALLQAQSDFPEPEPLEDELAPEVPIEEPVPQPVQELPEELETQVDQKPEIVAQIAADESFDIDRAFRQAGQRRRARAQLEDTLKFAQTVQKLNKAGFEFEPVKPGEKLNPMQASLKALGIRRVRGKDAIKSPEDVADLRKEVLKSKVFNDMTAVDAAFNKVDEASRIQSAAGDVAMIFNFMKILDPGSVVREGEFATAQNAAGVPQRVTNLYNRLLRGERLAPQQRKDFLRTAKEQAKAQFKAFKVATQPIRTQAEIQGLDPTLIFPKFQFEQVEEQKVRAIRPGSTVRIRGKLFRVMDDGDTLQEIK